MTLHNIETQATSIKYWLVLMSDSKIIFYQHQLYVCACMYNIYTTRNVYDTIFEDERNNQTFFFIVL